MIFSEIRSRDHGLTPNRHSGRHFNHDRRRALVRYSNRVHDDFQTNP